MRRRNPVALLAALALLPVLGGCAKDMTGPGRNGGITVSVAGTPSFSISRTIDGYPRANCDASLKAQGSHAATINWGDATFYWFTGLDRNKTKDSAVVSASEIQADWDTTGVGATNQLQGGWTVSDGYPFDIEIVFHYRIGAAGSVYTTRVRFTCGAAAPTGTISAPAISQLAITPTRARWQPEDTMFIQYQASSAGGLWFTDAQIRDAFTTDAVSSDSLRTTSQRSVPQLIWGQATLGRPVVVNFWAVDAFGQETEQTVQTAPLVDLTPPLMQMQLLVGTSYTSILGGTYFAGDTVGFVPHITDNHSLGALVWRAIPGPAGDSIVIHGGGEWGDFPVAVQARAAWGDSVRFRWYAFDSVGNVSDTLTTAPHAFKVFPTLTRPTVMDSLNGPIDGTVVDTARAAVYVLQNSMHRIAILSLSTLQQTGTIALPGQPVSFDITPGGDSLLVALHGAALAVVDLRQPTATPTLIPLAGVDTAAFQYPAQMRIAANDRAFIVLTGTAVTADSLLEVNLATGAQHIRTDAGGPLKGIARSLDQRVLAAARDVCVERYDVTTDAFGPCVATTPAVDVPSVDRTGQHFAIGLTAYDSSFTPVQTVQSVEYWGEGPGSVMISADGSYLYYLGARGFVRTRVSDGAILDRTTLSWISPSEMHLSPDGNSMVVTGGDRWSALSAIAIVDLRDADAQSLMARSPARVPMLPRSSTRSAPAAVQRTPLVSPREMLRRVSPPTARPWRRPAVPSVDRGRRR